MGAVWQERRPRGNWVLHPFGCLRTIECMFAPAPARPDYATWSDAALCAEIQAQTAAVERAQAELTHLAGIWLDRQAWRSESGLSSRSWLAAHTPMTRASAA